jgi:hypothetical protein
MPEILLTCDDVNQLESEQPKIILVVALLEPFYVLSLITP